MTKRTCSVDGCPSRHEARGLCDKHYQRLRKYGDPLGPGACYGDDLPGEHWLPVPGWENLYEVSNQGRVRSLPRDGAVGRMLKPTPAGPEKRLTVKLSRDGRAATKPVHRLVAEAFLGSMPVGMETRHLDGDCQNNAATNLAYGTHLENMADQARHGTHHQAGKTHCLREHEFTAENTYINPSSGARQCRACMRDARSRPAS